MNLERGLLVAQPALIGSIGRGGAGGGRRGHRRGGGVDLPAVDVTELDIVDLDLQWHFGHPDGDGSAGFDVTEASRELGLG